MSLYDDHSESRELLRNFMALALLPTSCIHEGFMVLKQKSLTTTYKEEIRPFVSYFENEWFHRFDPSTWSVNKKTWRTNNFAEGEYLVCNGLIKYPIHTSLVSHCFCFSTKPTFFFTSCSTTSEFMVFHPMFKARRKRYFPSHGSEWLRVFFRETNRFNAKSSTKDKTD